MAIARFYTETATVNRYVWTTDGDGFDISNESSVGSVMGHLQQASPEFITNTASRYTISHLFWCNYTEDVREGDVLVIDSERYGVRGVQDNGFVGDNKHLEVHLEKEDDNEVES